MFISVAPNSERINDVTNFILYLCVFHYRIFYENNIIQGVGWCGSVCC